MRKQHRWIAIILSLVVSVGLLLCACKNKETEEQGFTIYYLNKNATALYPVSTSFRTTDVNGQIGEIISNMTSKKQEVEYTNPIPDNVTIRSYALVDGSLEIHFSRDYETLTNTREALLRAAVVKTFCGLEDVKEVIFYVVDDPLHDETGNVISAMTANSFVDDFAREQEAVVTKQMTFYYPSADGDTLVEETRLVHYNTNISLPMMLLRYLSYAPETKGSQAAFASRNMVLNATVSDGICYVDLDASILSQESNITQEALVYSIVNTLTTQDSITKVKITVLSTTSAIEVDNNQLDGTYEPNLSLIED
ncbi:MAG: GerMN domain-containing protein [Lachnospiraceae bacterium]|nr:GerMN domain-containing protein [Lachnospiraceae bacterium]